MSALMALLNKAKAKYAVSGNDALRLKDGQNVFRILAPTKEQAPWVGPEGEFWQDLGVHWIKADETGKPLAVVGDPMTCFGEANPLDIMIEKAVAASYSEEDKKVYQGWRSQKRILVNVLDRSNKEEVPEVLELTRTTWSTILEQVGSYIAMGVNPLDQHTGVDIIITKTGRGLQTKYVVLVQPVLPGATSKPVSDEVMAKCHDLKAWVKSKYFREGDFEKAATTIASLSGVPVAGNAPAIASATPTAALTSSAAVVADASVSAAAIQTSPIQSVAQASVAEPAAVQGEVVEEHDFSADLDALAELDDILNSQG